MFKTILLPLDLTDKHDRALTVAAEMARVGWSDKDGRDFLIKRFNKLSRAELTGAEISTMIDHLVALPSKEMAV